MHLSVRLEGLLMIRKDKKVFHKTHPAIPWEPNPKPIQI